MRRYMGTITCKLTKNTVTLVTKNQYVVIARNTMNHLEILSLVSI